MTGIAVGVLWIITSLQGSQAPSSTVRFAPVRPLEMKPVAGGAAKLIALERTEPLIPPKLSPKAVDSKRSGEDPKAWEFDWLVTGHVFNPNTGAMSERFRVYSQERPDAKQRSIRAMRMLLRLWEMRKSRSNDDHPIDNKMIVDVYLSFGGKAGGEHRQIDDPNPGFETRQGLTGQWEEAPIGRGPIKANTIHIYDLATFTDSLEMAREIAHEYGHAVLPAVGGFSVPEYWANGDAGERVFLRWMRDAIAARQLDSDDVMGASVEALNSYVSANVDPYMRAVLTNGPDFSALEKDTKDGWEAYLGLVCYADAFLAPTKFGRSMKLTGSTRAIDYATAIVTAAEEQPGLEINLPKDLEGRLVWAPVGKGKVVEGTIKKRKGAWAQIAPSGRKVSIVYPALQRS